MAPTQPSGPADPDRAGQPAEFSHQEYDHRTPVSDHSLPGLAQGWIENLTGGVGNAMQRVLLAQGLSMRPPGEIPHTNAASYHHPELKQMVEASDAEQVHELGQVWNDLGNDIMDFGANLQRIATSSEAIWTGQAGNAAREALSTLAIWSRHTGQGVQFMGTTMRTQAEAAHTAQRAMPDPVPYDPADYQARLNSTNNPIAWMQIIGDAREQAERHRAAHAEAVRVIEAYGTSLRDTDTTMPAFTPPPQFGTGDTGPATGSPVPGGGAGGAVPRMGAVSDPAAGSVPHIGEENSPTAPRTEIGGPGSGGAPPSATPGQSAPHTPGLPGDNPAAGSGRAPGAGGGARPGEPGFLPAAAAATGAASSGGRGLRTGGGRAGAGGGDFGPRGSSGLGAVHPLSQGGVGSTGTAAAGRGPAGLVGHGAGAGGGFAPMAGAGRGRGDEDTEHRRPSYLVETEDIWGDGRRVAPPVIGEDPPKYYY